MAMSARSVLYRNLLRIAAPPMCIPALLAGLLIRNVVR